MGPVLLILLFRFVRADFFCYCNHNTDKPVYSSSSDAGEQPIGYIHGLDCKQVLNPLPNAWAAIAFEHQVGYINGYTDVQICPGNPLSIDAVTTKSITTTTTPKATTTWKQTTTTPKHTTTRVSTTTKSSTSVTSTSTELNGSCVCPANILQSIQADGGTAFIDETQRQCFGFVPTRLTWDTAENTCQQHGGHLATIHSVTQNDLLYSYVKSYGHPAWIGLNDKDHEEQFVWSSGEQATYRNWETARISTTFHKIENCVVMKPLDGTWDDFYCDLTRNAYICEYDAVIGHGSTNQATTPSSYNTDGNIHLCPHNIIQHNDRNSSYVGQYGQSCYEIIGDSKVTWSHGETKCSQNGGHLAYITNSHEQAFVEAFMNRHYPNHAVWIGLNDLNTEGHFEWTSGTPVSYTHWIPGHISNFDDHTREDCVVFVPYKNGDWDDIPCGTINPLFGVVGQTYPILCQYDISTNGNSVLVG